MPRPMRHGSNAKPKDMVGTWKKLFARLGRYRVSLVVALICAVLGVLCTLAGPDKLSELTNTVTAGLMPDQTALEDISNTMVSNLETNSKTLGEKLQENMQKAKELQALQSQMSALQEAPSSQTSMDPAAIDPTTIDPTTIDPSKIPARLMNPGSISNPAGMSGTDPAALQSQMEALKPEDIELNGQTITLEDQQEAAKALSSLAEMETKNKEEDKETDKKDSAADSESTTSNSEAKSTESDSEKSDRPEISQAIMDTDDAAKMVEQLENLPESVQKALLPDMTIQNTVISTQDQIEMVKELSKINPDDQQSALDAMDNLPTSVYSVIKPKMDMEKVTRIALSFAGLIALGWVLSLIQGWIMASITQKTSYAMREDISHKINRLPISYFEKTTIGDVLSRITNDIDTISQSLNQSISALLTNTVMLIGSLYLMVTTNLEMTATAIAASLIGFILMFVIMGHSQKYFNQMQNSLGRLNGHIEEIYTGHTVVKAYNDEAKALKQFQDYNTSMVNSSFKANAIASIMQPMMGFIGNFGYVAICVVGGAMALNGTITFGTIVAFIMYVRYFTQPLSQIAQAFSSMQSAAASGERVFAFLEEKEMSDESNKTITLDNTQGEVDFSHVRFHYPDADHDVIHDFSADAHHGQKIAIVGPTGAGKTTLVNLLMRFYELDGGAISIDGIKTTDMKRSEVHKQFCMVLQDTWLFEGTLRENLAYNTPNLSDEEIMKACKAVGLDHLVKTLPEGLDTVLNDQVSLSVGQKQQVTIARAMLVNHPMLILDEATSSVDTRTEQQIQKAMDLMMEKRTSFVIAHRLSTIKDADLILVMNHGDIVETGTHEQLLQKNGFYASLYNAQFDDSDLPDPMAPAQA